MSNTPYVLTRLHGRRTPFPTGKQVQDLLPHNCITFRRATALPSTQSALASNPIPGRGGGGGVTMSSSAKGPVFRLGKALGDWAPAPSAYSQSRSSLRDAGGAGSPSHSPSAFGTVRGPNCKGYI